MVVARTVPDHPRLKDLVAVRLERVKPDVRWMLEVLCLSEPLSLDELCDAVGLEAMLAGEDAGLILVERSGALAEVRFTHPLYSQLVRASLGKVRALRALRLLDAVLEKFPVRSAAEQLKRAAIRLETGDWHTDNAEVFTLASAWPGRIIGWQSDSPGLAWRLAGDSRLSTTWLMRSSGKARSTRPERQPKRLRLICRLRSTSTSPCGGRGCSGG